MNIFSVVLGNSVTIICFTLIAKWFNSPWYILLALLFYRNYTETSKKEEDKDYDVQ